MTTPVTAIANLHRATDWGATALGPMAGWSDRLRISVDLMLANPEPCCLFWGPQAVMIYNDRWARMLGSLHPAAFGAEVAAYSEPLHDACAALRAPAPPPKAQDDLRSALLPFLWAALEGQTRVPFTPVVLGSDDDGGILVTPRSHLPLMAPDGTDSPESATDFMLALSDRLRGLSDPTEIEAGGIEMLGEYIGADRANYAEVDLDAEQSFLAAEYRRDPRMPSMLGTYDLKMFRPALKLLMQGLPFMSTDMTRSHGSIRAALRDFVDISSGAQLSLGILRAGRLVATVTLRFAAPHDWTAEEISLVKQAAHRTWEAVERAKAEGETRRSEQRLRALITAASNVTFRMSADWTTMLEMRGSTILPDVTSPVQNWLEHYIDPEDHAAYRAAIRNAIASRTMLEVEVRVKRPDGTLKWASARAVPLKNAEGQITEWFGATVDVDARKQAEEALRLTERRLRLAQRAAGVGSFDWIIGTQEGSWSTEFLETLGMRPGDLGGRYEDWIALVHPDDRPRATREVELAMETGTLEAEWRILRRDGEEMNVLVRGVVDFDAKHRPVRLMGAQVDITDRVRAERSIALLMEEMDTRIEALKAQLRDRDTE